MPYEFTHAYVRNDSDFYVEPPWAVRALIKAITFEGIIHDPACGSGTIPKTFSVSGFGATGSDIKDRGFGVSGINYLQDKYKYENIVTNPPYNLAEAFIKHAIHNTERRIAILARVAFLNGQKRFKLYTEFPPEAVVILSRRPSMPPGGQNIMAQGGKTDFCWIVWSQKHDTRVFWSI